METRGVTRSPLATICHHRGPLFYVFPSFIRRSGVSHNTLFTEGSQLKAASSSPLKAKQPICSIPPWVKLEPSPRRRITVICVHTPADDRVVMTNITLLPAAGRSACIVLTRVRYRSVGRTFKAQPLIYELCCVQ